MNQEDRALINKRYDISVDDLKQVVQKYQQRRIGTEEVDFLRNQGGEKWLTNGLSTDKKQGISNDSLLSRENFYGHNRKHKIKVKSFWELIKIALDDLILKALIVAGIASIIINLILEEEERGTAWIEGFAILLAVAIVALVTAYNDLKKEQEFQKLNEKAEKGKIVSIIRNGQIMEEANMQDVMVGDILRIKGGMEIPADGIIVEANSIQMDESPMTGETKPMKKNTIDTCNQKKEILLQQKDQLSHDDVPSPVMVSGSRVLTGTGKMIIINVGENSAIGQIEKALKTGDQVTPLQLKLEKMARDIGWFAMGSAVMLFLVLAIRFIIEESIDGWDDDAIDYVKEFLEYFILAITILVVAIPEGLPLAVTLSLAFSVNEMAKEQNLVRRMQACETMGGANIICSDKTGTLTRNEMYWTHLWNGEEREIFNCTSSQAISFHEFSDPKAAEFLINTVLLNSDEDPSRKNGNPTEMALLKYFHLLGFGVVQYREYFNEIIYQAPFNSNRKRMSRVVRVNGKDYVFMKGASEYMLKASDKIHYLHNNQIVSLQGDMKIQAEDAINHMATQALRTIGLCYKEVNAEQLDFKDKDDKGILQFEQNGFTLIGIAGIKDVIRPEVPENIKKCNMAGIDVKMVTGDNKVTAKAIAKEIGLIKENETNAIVLEGPDFMKMIEGVVCSKCKTEECDCPLDEEQLKESKKIHKDSKIRVDTIKNGKEFDKIWRNLKVLARSRPQDKYALVVGLKERDNVVAVTGDGTNDAPALSKADVGFAMNIAGTEVAKQAADILILDDNFASIVKAVKWGRNIYDSIRKFLQFQLTVNVVAVVTTFICAIILAEPIFSAVQMLWINLIMDSLAALALATEPPTESLLKRKPYKRDEYIINPLMMKHIIGQSIWQCIIIFIVVFVGEHFLPDAIAKRQLRSGNLIVNGRKKGGYRREDWDNEYSVHYTYNFNIFVFLQIFNFFNCRVLDDSLNVFRGITRSKFFIPIVIIIVVLQVVFITFLGKAIRVVMWGLDPIGWLISVGIGSTSLITSVILKFIPMEKCLTGKGNSELDVNDLNEPNFVALRKNHTKDFFKNQSGISVTNSKKLG